MGADMQLVQSSSTISAEAGQSLISAAILAAERAEVPMSIAIVDPGGGHYLQRRHAPGRVDHHDATGPAPIRPQHAHAVGQAADIQGHSPLEAIAAVDLCGHPNLIARLQGNVRFDGGRGQVAQFEQLGNAVGRNQYVAGFQVAMHNQPLVRVVHR